MPAPLAARRLEIFAAARREPGFLSFDPARLRFRLGTSLADLRIPVLVTDDARGIVRAAAAEVALLLSTHHKGFVPAEDLDRLILREDYASLPRAAPTLGPSGGGPDIRAAAQLGARAHPALAGGVVCAWMGPGGRGRSLTALFIGTLRQALAEMRDSGVEEETPLIALLALHGEMLAAAADLREALPGPPLDRYLRSAAVAATWIAARTGLARAWREEGRSADDPLLARLEAVLSPAALLGGRAAAQGGGSTFYGCELAAGVPRADEIAGRLAEGGDPDAAQAGIVQALGAEEEVARRAEQAVAVARMRELLLGAVSGAEAAAPEALAELRELYCAPGGLAAALAEEGARKGLARLLGDAAGRVGAGEPAQLLDRAGRALKGWKPREPAAALGLRRAEARAEYAAAAAALLCDVALERLASPVRRVLMLRTGAEAEGGPEAEWEAGRLYRVSARGGPLLARAVQRPVGHLFADVKDFTRRTGLLGQAAMAEFLRSEFYLPILGAAKRHFGGMQHLADRGGVSVNNLVGDAISFSGDVESLVELALAIRRHLDDYRSRLQREVSREAVARQIEAIEERFRGELERASREAAEAGALAGRAARGGPEEAQALHRRERAAAEEAALREERARALARARGEELEAGVFVSYGPAPLVVVIDDEVFGRSRVAIADKINESARGTARASSARARADALLAAERAARGSPALEHAWNVFVGRPLGIPVAAEVEERALEAARAGDLAGAMRAVAGPVREALEAAAGVAGDAPGDVYNSGAALSGEALEAYLAAVSRSRVVRRLELAPEQIPEPLRARYLFGQGPESLVAAFHPDGRLAELFRYAGKGAFKGLGDVPIWELCSETGAPAALAQALGPAWFRGRPG